jgi:hypothetical protein
LGYSALTAHVCNGIMYSRAQPCLYMNVPLFIR